MIDIYNRIDEAKYVIQILDILKDVWPNQKNLHEIPNSAPPNPESAYVARKLAFEDIRDNRENLVPIKDSWQHYWFSCCTSDKCDFVFKLLKSKGVDREDDLKKICSLESDLFHKLDDETKQPYIDLCISYLLKRYNISDSREIWKRSPKKTFVVRLQLFLLRLVASILVGYIVIATSSEIWDFANINQPNQPLFLLLYSFGFLILSYIYLLFECLKITQGTINSRIACKRAFSVLESGIIYSLAALIIFRLIYFLQMLCTLETVHETFLSHVFDVSYICRLIFYAMFAFFIGIIIQLLWEEKTVSEPF
ncbi:hypothetical protein FXW07_09780 [Methanosarcina sp. DH1]|uniref:hypothetical protein n=1 Tax=Methanosarcina sp. DH1 TaxID=2605695 RepID=UPI001E5BA652|nr:hypothetical protein [Methanosarcina sp. DH1]MCC4766895.1 hypothetical protein [Methanosarcina sp. DH1]